MLIWEEKPISGQSRDTGVFASYKGYQIIRRNGAVVPFEPNRVAHAMMRAFMVMHGVLSFAQNICSGWLHGLWRAIKPSKACAHRVTQVAGLDRSLHVTPQQGWFKPLRFFGSNKPDMRNAP
jgi:hypothetical protein